MNRVILVNRTHSPSREALVTTERAKGEDLFRDFPGLHWAGYITAEGKNKIAANWIIPGDLLDSFHEFARSVDDPTHEVMVFGPGHTQFGGQCEVRII